PPFILSAGRVPVTDARASRPESKDQPLRVRPPAFVPCSALAMPHDPHHDHRQAVGDTADDRAGHRADPPSTGPSGCGHCLVEPKARAEEHSHAPQAGADHAHEEHGAAHTHSFHDLAVRKLKIALALTLGFMFVEVAVGLYARSLALTSDGGHMLADGGALMLALIAQRFATKRATRDRTYGFRRAETLAAFVNGVLLTGTALWVLSEAWDRFRHPVPMRAGMVLVVATLGLLVNLASALILSRGTGHNLNTRAALAHVMFDAIGSVAAILAGFVAWRWRWYRLDPALSVAMAGLILYGAWAILKRAVTVLMEGTPSGLDLAGLEATIRGTPGVADMHDLHAWTISEGFDVITVHVVLAGEQQGTDVARRVGERIHAIHQVAHVTVQPEIAGLPRGVQPTN
ncbi:MAG: cation diffusion facilitator family transporter, partial [Deltaproteobacteria bacterium]